MYCLYEEGTIARGLWLQAVSLVILVSVSVHTSAIVATGE